MADRRRIGRNNKARGKSIERAFLPILSDAFGQEFHRNPDNGAKQADVESETRVVEIKGRQTATPALMRDAWQQALKANEETGKEAWLGLSFVDGGRRSYWIARRLV